MKVRIADPAALSMSLTRLACSRIAGVPLDKLLACAFQIVWLADDAALPAGDGDAQHEGRWALPPAPRLVVLS